jgi:hypothetical protein
VCGTSSSLIASSLPLSLYVLLLCCAMRILRGSRLLKVHQQRPRVYKALDITITCLQVLPNCYLWVETATGRRHKVLKLPPSSTGTSVSPHLPLQTLPRPDCTLC